MQFAYTVKNQEGAARSGVLEAPDRESAVRTLVGQGLVVTRLTAVKEARGSWAPWSSGRLTTEQLLSLTQSISAMLEAGMTLTRALSILSVDAQGPALQQILLRVDSQVKEGRPFSAALSDFPKVFSRLYVAMVEAGEASGKLPSIMARLAQYLEASAELQGKIRTALLYPLVVLGFAACLVVGLMLFAVPRLTSVYAGLGHELPWATAVFIHAGQMAARLWWLWLPLVLVSPAALYRLTRTRAWDRFKLTAPVLGPLFQREGIARFARTLGSLYVSGVPIAAALDIVARSTENRVLEDAVREVSNNVVKGETLASQMRETQVFTPIAVGMIAAGEESGALERMLDRLAAYYESQVNLALKAAVGLIEPLLMIGVGLVVGGIMLVIALPFLQMGSVMS